MKLEEIKGNARTKEILQEALKNGRLAGTLLFVGPGGVGKSLMAGYLAKSVNCLNSNFAACDNCNSCLRIEARNHPDVHWVEKDDSGSIKIDQVRQIEKEIQLKPYEGKKKVFIIIEAQDLTLEACNALLKTLEEPPSNSLLILTSAHADQLLPTVLSRCQKFFFTALGPEALKNVLMKDYKMEEKTSHFLAYFSQGRIGKAVAFSQTDILRRKNDFLNHFLHNFASQEYFDNNFFAQRQKIIEGLEILMDWFRDVLLLKIGLEAKHVVNADRLRDLEALRKRYSFDELQEIMGDIIFTIRLLQQNINVKIGFSALRAKICQG